MRGKKREDCIGKKGKVKKKKDRKKKRRKSHHLQDSPCTSCSPGNSRTGTASTEREHSNEGHGTRPPGVYCFLSPSQGLHTRTAVIQRMLIQLLLVTADCHSDLPGRCHRCEAQSCSPPSAWACSPAAAPVGIYETQILFTLILRSLQVLPHLLLSWPTFSHMLLFSPGLLSLDSCLDNAILEQEWGLFLGMVPALTVTDLSFLCPHPW